MHYRHRRFLRSNLDNIVRMEFAILISFLVVASLSLTDECGATRDIRNFALPTPVSQAMHDFAFDMYGKISSSVESDENLVFSPISLYTILSTLSLGLDGNSLEQVQAALRIEEMNDVAALQEQSRMLSSIFTRKFFYVMKMANKVFVDERTQLRKSYKNATERFSKGSFKKLDFANQPRRSLSRVNRYVAKHTNNQTRELIPPDGVDSTTRMVLVNAIYMQSAWRFPFDKSLTTDQTFQLNAMESAEVPMMTTRESTSCHISMSHDLDAKVLVIPFEGDAMTMVVIVPNQVGNFAPFEGPGASDRIERVLTSSWIDARGRSQARRGYPIMQLCLIRMPKFSIKFKIEGLIEKLRAMGVTDIFSEAQADLSRMTPERGLCVTDARHEATIDVSESGVEASAASSIGVSWRIAPTQFDVDKPFLFFIRHEVTGAVMFVGRYMGPQSTD